MNSSWIIGIQHVWFGISIFLLLLLLICRTTFFREAISAKHFSRRHMVFFILLFSILSICGTYWNVEAGGGIINFRAVGIILAGFIGGPVVGTVTGVITGLHRAFFISTDAAFIHGGLTIIQGIAAGFLSKRLKKHHHQLWMWAFLDAFILEILFWLFFAFLTFPQTISHPEDFFALSLPIIVTNTIAVSLFYMVRSEKTQTTKNTFDAVAALFATLHDGFNDANISKIAELMTSSLPSLIWTAISYRNQFYTRTNYKTEADETQGDAEIAILKLQKSLPDMPHLMTLPVTYRHETVGWIIAAKSKGDTFTKLGVEFLHGICHVMEAIYEYDRMKEEENLLAEAEIRALQAQINPHFLYNILASVQNLLSFGEITKANKMLADLSLFYKGLLRTSNDLIPIKKELEIAQLYMEMEALCKDNLFDWNIDMEEGIENFLICKFTLQPILENSIQHGFKGNGIHMHIDISIRYDDDMIEIMISDNGIGMSPEKLNELREGIVSKQIHYEKHFGISNINSRICSSLQGHGTLRVESNKDTGTTIYIRIPQLLEDY